MIKCDEKLLMMYRNGLSKCILSLRKQGFELFLFLWRQCDDGQKVLHVEGVDQRGYHTVRTVRAYHTRRRTGETKVRHDTW